MAYSQAQEAGEILGNTTASYQNIINKFWTVFRKGDIDYW